MKPRKPNKKLDWSNYCATDKNRNQCSKENCMLWNICKIKTTVKQEQERIFDIIADWRAKADLAYEPFVAKETILAVLDKIVEQIKKETEK